MDESFSPLLHSLPEYLHSARFSDGTIKCGEQAFNIHKIILCAQSKYFLNAFTGDWKESEDGAMALEDDDVAAVEAMFQFMYTFTYDAGGGADGTSSPMVFHVKVYSIADKYDVPALKAQAEEKFKKAAEVCWDMDDFPYAVAQVYEATPPGDQGIRKVVVDVASRHVDELLSKQEFQDVLDQTIGFAADMARRLAGGQEKSQSKKYTCPHCNYYLEG